MAAETTLLGMSLGLLLLSRPSFGVNFISQFHLEGIKDGTLLSHIIETAICLDVSEKQNESVGEPFNTFVFQQTRILPAPTDRAIYDVPSHRHADDGDLAY